MDERVIDGRPSGDSRCGRHLFEHLPASGAEILAAGASDWVVHPVAGRYPGDEAAFLHPIIDWIETALRDHPELDGQELKGWVEARRRHIDDARLTYIAHQIRLLRPRAGQQGGGLECGAAAVPGRWATRISPPRCHMARLTTPSMKTR